VTASTVLAIAAILTGAGERAVPRGWFVRFGDDAWAYAPPEPDGGPERSRPASFVHFGEDGTAIQLTVTLREDTSSGAGAPKLSAMDGFVVWSGTWRRTQSGAVDVELALRLSSKVVGDPPLTPKISATAHGRHLLTSDGALVPLAFAYPVDAATVRKQLFEYCCSVPGRDPACRSVRR
jgi:hypothetical protein